MQKAAVPYDYTPGNGIINLEEKMKKLLKIVSGSLVAAALAFGFTACPGSPDPVGPVDPVGPEEPVETVIMDTATEIDWGTYCIVTADKFTADEPQTICIYFDCGAKAEDKAYVSLKINGNYNNFQLGDGVATGAVLKSDDKGAFENLPAFSTKNNVITYKPTAEEWAAIKAGADRVLNDAGDKCPDGLYINGFNVTITKITLK